MLKWSAVRRLIEKGAIGASGDESFEAHRAHCRGAFGPAWRPVYRRDPLCGGCAAEEYGAAKVSLFGSHARGEADESSDVDILLEKGAIKGMRVLDFQDELEQRLGRSVDVVTTAGASQRFLARIKPDEVVLYEAV